MKKIIATIALLLVLIASIAMGAGSVTVTTSQGSGDAMYVQFEYIGNATGGEVPSTSSIGNWPTAYTGCIYAMESNPGSPAPSADFDITITDSDGVDLLGGQGTDLSNTTSAMLPAKMGTVFGCVPTQGAFTFNFIGNGTNSSTGTIKVFIYEDGND